MDDPKRVGKDCLVLPDVGAGKVSLKVLGRRNVVVGL